MKKLLVGCLMMAMVALAPSQAQANGRGPCSGRYSDVTPNMPLEQIQHRTQVTIACAERIWSVPGGLSSALFYANRESHFYPWAANPSGCLGVYQHMSRYWPGRVSAWIDRNWYSKWRWDQGISAFDMRANVIVTMRMAHSTGWGPWGG